MSVRPYRDIFRRKSRQIHVGSVAVGGDAPITVQSMTNTLTRDAAATIEQIRALVLVDDPLDPRSVAFLFCFLEITREEYRCLAVVDPNHHAVVVAVVWLSI